MIFAVNFVLVVETRSLEPSMVSHGLAPQHSQPNIMPLFIEKVLAERAESFDPIFVRFEMIVVIFLLQTEQLRKHLVLALFCFCLYENRPRPLVKKVNRNYRSKVQC